jgi:gliding motility-associated-like protein
VNLDSSNSNTTAFKLSEACRDIDSDGDMVMNSYDLDTDNDGIYDVIESGNSNRDTDGDGRINDVAANDTDFNGRHDAAVNPIDTDGDLTSNYKDKDSDGDTISDLIEGGNYKLDLDGDGTLDDVDLNFDGVIDAALFADSDNDGFHDAANKVPLNSDFNNDSSDKIPDNADDGIPDYIDLDSDDDDCDDKYESGLSSAATSFNYPDDINTNGVFDFQEYLALLPKDLPVEISACENGTNTLKLELKDASYNYDDIVWQNSTDNGSNWNNLSDSTFYSGTTTNELILKNIPLTSNNYLFRAVISRDDYVCGATLSTNTKLIVNPLPEVAANWSGELIQCDDDTDGLSVFNLLEVREKLSVIILNETFEFYTDINDLSTLISDPTNFNNSVANQTIQVKIIIDASGCSIVENIVLKAISNTLPTSLNEQAYQVCYDYTDNKTTFDFRSIEDPTNPGTYITFDDYVLNAYTDGILRQVTYYESYNDALIEKDSIANLSAFEVDGLSEGGTVNIWVRVDDQLINSCNGIKDLIQLQVLPDTSFEIDPNILNPLNPTENELVICNTASESIELLLNTTVNLSNLEFEWTFPDGSTNVTSFPENNVSDEGVYSVSVYNILNKTCEFSDIFKVSRYTINEPQLSFFEITSGTKSNAIKLLDILDESDFGPNNYEFSLEDEDGNTIHQYQDYCNFNGLTGGFYKLYIRDEAQCDEKFIIIPVLYFPTFITPNSDGYNDTWEVKGIDLDEYNLDLTKLYIFNRYGKLLGSLSLDQSWDGTFNGRPLEATDYWYKVDLVKKSGEVFQPIMGHFSLLK